MAFELVFTPEPPALREQIEKLAPHAKVAYIVREEGGARVVAELKASVVAGKIRSLFPDAEVRRSNKGGLKGASRGEKVDL